MRLVSAISGASGAVYGIRALQVLKKLNIETNLPLTNAALQTISLETDYSRLLAIAATSYLAETSLLTWVSSPAASSSARNVLNVTSLSIERGYPPTLFFFVCPS